MQAFHGWLKIKPKGLRNAFAGLALLGVLCGSAQAERLRISPDDLKLRFAVSEQLSPALRREILELAKSVPVPVAGGVLQTETLFQERFGDRGWGEKRLTLTRYYFLIARMEHSELFSDEFYRRRTLLRDGIELLENYIRILNPLIARAPYVESEPPELEKAQDFPLQEVGTTDDGQVKVLHLYPAPKLSMGRENLRRLREQAASEIDRLWTRYDQLDRAEHEFLDEMSLLGTEVMSMRGAVKRWVTVTREGLPFSP